MTTSRRVGWALLLGTCIGALGCSYSPSPDFAPPAEVAPRSEPAANLPPLITVTPRARTMIQQIIAESHLPTGHLRVRVVPGGCCGFLHKLDLDPDVSSVEDDTFESAGVKVVVLKRQREMLRGAEVDYGREGDRTGFKIKNPNFEGEALKKWLPILQKDKRTD